MPTNNAMNNPLHTNNLSHSTNGRMHNGKKKRKKGKGGKSIELLDMDNDELTLGAKGHYYPHGVEWQKLWQMSLGYADEESVEKFHKECGSLGIKYVMDHLLLITSPEYAQ